LFPLNYQKTIILDTVEVDWIKFSEYESTKSVKVTLDIPKGYQLESIPKTMQYIDDILTFTFIAKELVGNTIVYEFELQIKKSEIIKTEFKRFSDINFKIENLLKSNIVLIKN
jgi:hypothetical protein